MHDRDSYGRAMTVYGGVSAHRFIFGYAYPWIKFDHLTLDHLCEHRDCVNPTHLEPVPSGENSRRIWKRASAEKRQRMRKFYFGRTHAH